MVKTRKVSGRRIKRSRRLRTRRGGADNSKPSKDSIFTQNNPIIKSRSSSIITNATGDPRNNGSNLENESEENIQKAKNLLEQRKKRYPEYYGVVPQTPRGTVPSFLTRKRLSPNQQAMQQKLASLQPAPQRSAPMAVYNAGVQRVSNAWNEQKEYVSSGQFKENAKTLRNRAVFAVTPGTKVQAAKNYLKNRFNTWQFERKARKEAAEAMKKTKKNLRTSGARNAATIVGNLTSGPSVSLPSGNWLSGW